MNSFAMPRTYNPRDRRCATHLRRTCGSCQNFTGPKVKARGGCALGSFDGFFMGTRSAEDCEEWVRKWAHEIDGKVLDAPLGEADGVVLRPLVEMAAGLGLSKREASVAIGISEAGVAFVAAKFNVRFPTPTEIRTRNKILDVAGLEKLMFRVSHATDIQGALKDRVRSPRHLAALTNAQRREFYFLKSQGMRNAEALASMAGAKASK